MNHQYFLYFNKKKLGLERLGDNGNELYNVARNDTYWQIQGVSRLQGITAGGDFLGLCDQKRSYEHVSDFGRLRSYGRLKLRIEGNDY